jgi:hypothetical protein
MTEQEKTFIAREFDKLENQLDSKYALYENGYRSALFDALEVVNKLPIHNVSKSFYCREKEALNQKCESVCDVCSNWAFRFRYYKQR